MTGSYNAGVLERLAVELHRFSRGEIDIERVQVSLQGALGLLERTTDDVASLVRSAEVAIEGIRFKVGYSEQREAALEQLVSLRSRIAELLSGADGDA